MIEFHLWLRDELDDIRENVDSYFRGGESPELRPQDLRAHCLTFCSALTRHHTAEDDNAFPVVAEYFPELRPVLEELNRDHRTVAGAMTRLDWVLDRLDELGVERVRTELATLAALLQTHFVYEEKRIADALDSLTSRADPADAERLGRPMRRTG